MKKKKIIHLTSAHPRYDIRIFIKMCSSIARANYDISLVVADGKGYEEKNLVKIYDVGKSNRRFERMLKSSLLVFKRALSLNGDIYHLHDPELLPYAYLLKLKGKKVIFDSHEDTPRQILSKHYFLYRQPNSEINGLPCCHASSSLSMKWKLWFCNYDLINKVLLKTISFLYEIIEKYICSKLDYIITATPFIRDIFSKYNSNTKDINNFPILPTKCFELNTKTNDKEIINKVCYVGAITKNRGCYKMVKALELLKNPVKLCLAGNFDKSVNMYELKKMKGWNNVEYKGYVQQDELKSILNNSFAGLVTLFPIINYIDSLPTKMFEYMLAGIPVIASNFPLWKEIIENNDCGLYVNPTKPEEIAKAIDYLYEHTNEAKRMGTNGKKAIFDKYNWENEEKKLLDIYNNL